MSLTVDEIERFAASLAPLDRRANQAWWTASTDTSDANEAERIAADLALREALADPTMYAALATVADEPAERCPARQAAVLRDRMAPQQISASIRDEMVRGEARIDRVFNEFRPTLDGAAVDDNAILEILRTSDDADLRRRAYLASKQVGAEVAEGVRELARLRNRAAQELGARDYFALTLETSELDENALLETLAAVEAATDEPFSGWKADDDRRRAERFGCSVAELRPWHYDDPFFQSAPESRAVDLDAWFADTDLVALTRTTYAGIGLDIDPILVRSDLLPRGGKSQHAFCIDVDREGDVRVLCNNVPGARWAETMLHEFGHAVYDTGVDADLPWSIRTMHPLTTEGIAMLFGRLPLDPEWLELIAGVPHDTVTAAAPALAHRRLTMLLVFARWVLVMTHFERSLYADPDADLDRLWWDLVERFQGLTRPDGRDAPDWAAKIHIALAPVYYQNYLLGEMVASQLQATLGDRFGGIVGRPDAGRFLADAVFRPGWSVRWDELIESATGRPLGVDAFAAEIRSLTAG